MAITRNNLQTSSTDTLLYTPSVVTDSCLVVLISSEDVGNNEPITSVMFGATPMVLEGVGVGIVGTNSNDIALAYLVNPGASAQTITVTGGQHDRMGVVALTLDNVDQADPIDASDASFSTVATALMTTTATTTNAESYVLSGAIGGNATDLLNVTGATRFLTFAPPSSRAAAADSTQTIAGTYSHDWTCNVSGRNASVSAAFNLASAGGISITPDSVNTNYTSLNPSISLTGSISITEQVVNTNYAALNPAISFVGVVSISEQLKNINYTSLDPVIDLTGLVDITESTVNSNYTSLAATITLTSGAIEVIESKVNTQYLPFNPGVLLTPEPLGVVSTVCFNGVMVDLSFAGEQKEIEFTGSVNTLVFNGNFNELEFNGTIQTTCNTGSIKTNC